MHSYLYQVNIQYSTYFMQKLGIDNNLAFKIAFSKQFLYQFNRINIFKEISAFYNKKMLIKGAKPMF